MSDDIYNFLIYKNYSLDLLNYTIYFFIFSVIFGNLSICLTKLYSSSLLSMFTSMIDDIISEITTTDPDIYNPYKIEERNKKVKEVFGRYLKNNFKELDENEEHINNLINRGTTNKVVFDLIINKKSNEEDYYLVYYKFKKEFIEKFLKYLYGVFHGNNYVYIFFMYTIVRFQLLCIKVAEQYLHLLYLLTTILSERILLLIFAVPYILTWFMSIIGSIISIVFFLYFTFYFFIKNFYMIFMPLWNYFNDGINKATEKYNTEKENLSKLKPWVPFIFTFGSFMSWIGKAFLLLILFIPALITIIIVWFMLMSIFVFAFSFLGVLLYGLFRVCIWGVQGFFVESCNADNNCKDKIDYFNGNEPFDLSESMILTFLKYTLTYYLLYIILIIFPITHKTFGINIIIPFLIFGSICYYFIHSFTHELKKNLSLNPDDYGFGPSPSDGESGISTDGSSSPGGIRRGKGLRVSFDDSDDSAAASGVSGASGSSGSSSSGRGSGNAGKKVNPKKVEQWLNDNPSYAQIIYSWLFNNDKKKV